MPITWESVRPMLQWYDFSWTSKGSKETEVVKRNLYHTSISNLNIFHFPIFPIFLKYLWYKKNICVRFWNNIIALDLDAFGFFDIYCKRVLQILLKASKNTFLQKEYLYHYNIFSPSGLLWQKVCEHHYPKPHNKKMHWWMLKRWGK